MRLARNSFEGLGIDMSKYAIAYASHQAKQKELDKLIHFKVGNESILTTKSIGTFDIIVTGETLEHIKNDNEIVSFFFKILKKGGVCVVSVPAHPNQWDINDDFSSHFRRYEKANLEKLFSDAGFKEIQSFYWGYPLSYYWHKFVYLPMIADKIKQNKKYTSSPGLLGTVLTNNFMKKLFSIPFWFDQLFNQTGKGGGLILVARK